MLEKAFRAVRTVPYDKTYRGQKTAFIIPEHQRSFLYESHCRGNEWWCCEKCSQEIPEKEYKLKYGDSVPCPCGGHKKEKCVLNYVVPRHLFVVVSYIRNNTGYISECNVFRLGRFSAKQLHIPHMPNVHRSGVICYGIGYDRMFATASLIKDPWEQAQQMIQTFFETNCSWHYVLEYSVTEKSRGKKLMSLHEYMNGYEYEEVYIDVES